MIRVTGPHRNYPGVTLTGPETRDQVLQGPETGSESFGPVRSGPCTPLCGRLVADRYNKYTCFQTPDPKPETQIFKKVLKKRSSIHSLFSVRKSFNKHNKHIIF